jgi:hypothetical protein
VYRPPDRHGGGGGRLAGVLYVARQDDPERHHGIVVRLHESVFVPPAALLDRSRPGALRPPTFRVASLRHLQELWQRDPEAFLGLIELAGGGSDLTLVDDWGTRSARPGTSSPRRSSSSPSRRRDDP